MNIKNRTVYILFIQLFIIVFSSIAQNKFQKIYQPSTNLTCQIFYSQPTKDGGFIFGGVIDTIGNTTKMVLTKASCIGNVQWSKTYDITSKASNVYSPIIVTSDKCFVLAGNSGMTGSFNISIIKLDSLGNTIWHKQIIGNRDDMVTSIIETLDHNYVLVGRTNSWGQDALTNYEDIYMAKLDGNGNFLWGKTYGTSSAIERAEDIVELVDGNYAITGSCYINGGRSAFIMKTNTSGVPSLVKAFGATNHWTDSHQIIQTIDGGFAICGGTTIMKTDFQNKADEFIIKTNATADTLWCKSYHATVSDYSESASSIIETPNGYVLAVSAQSYPTVGFIGDKNVILKTNFNGNLTQAVSYDQGGSFFGYLSKSTFQSGYISTGFVQTPSFNYQPIIRKLDDNLSSGSGCTEYDLFSLTAQQTPVFSISTPTFIVSNGGAVSNSLQEANASFSITTKCETIIDNCTNLSGINEENLIVNKSVLYPNPFKSIIHISNTLSLNEIKIYDITSRLVFTKNCLNKDSISLEFSNLENGIYLIQLNSINGSSEIRKIIKE